MDGLEGKRAKCALTVGSHLKEGRFDPNPSIPNVPNPDVRRVQEKQLGIDRTATASCSWLNSLFLPIGFGGAKEPEIVDFGRVSVFSLYSENIVVGCILDASLECIMWNAGHKDSRWASRFQA